MILITAIVSHAFAQSPSVLQRKTEIIEKSAFEQELERNTNFRTEERWVQFGDTKYRQVEYRGQKYYIKLTGRVGDFGELDCSLGSGNLNPRLIETGVQIFRRSKMFVDFLQETCARDSHGQARAKVRLDPRLGFTIPDGPKSVITNKKVYIDPRGLGFSGDW